MELLVTSVLTTMAGLTLGDKPPILPTIGAGTSKFRNCTNRAPGITNHMIPTTKTKPEIAMSPNKDRLWTIRNRWWSMSTTVRHLPRSISWPLFSGTFLTMTDRPTWPYWNDWSTPIRIRSRSSRRQTWPTLPAIWPRPRPSCRRQRLKWRHSQISAIDPVPKML